MTVDGDMAYIGDGPGGFTVADVSDPTAPRVIGHAPVPWCRHVALNGSHAYTGGLDQLHVVDVSDPTDSKHVSTLSTPELPSELVVDGDHSAWR